MTRIPTALSRTAAAFAALTLAGAAWTAIPSVAGGVHPASAAPAPPATPQQIVYAGGGHLWLVPVDGGAPRLIRTPWPLATGPNGEVNAQWSPDAQLVAVDDGKSRFAVIDLSTGHQTLFSKRSCTSECAPPLYSWSPNSRYLAILRPYGDGTFSTLLVWDRTNGKTHTLFNDVSGYVSDIDWSHDGTRILVSVGRFDTVHTILPNVTIVTLSGQKRTLSKGIGYGWSPDDRFVGIVNPHMCGANTCDEAEEVQPAAGGPPITLTNHIASTSEYAEWAQGRPPGGARYAFDRWLLGLAGHIFRRLAGPNERVDSWSPDGGYAAIQTYHPYYETPDALFISTPQGARVHLYTAGRKDSCGACSKATYQVTWGQCGSGLVAFATPIYPTPKLVDVYPKLFLTRLDGTAETRIQVPGNDASIVSFAEHDTALIIQSGGKLYQYTIATRSLTQIASGVSEVANPPLDGTGCV